MDPKPSALIIGCGYIGRQLQSLLRQQGWQTTGITRSSPSSEHHLSIDVTQSFSLPQRYDVVFYMISAGTYTPEAYHQAYTLGVDNSLRALKAFPQQPRFIFVSSTSVFQENEGGIVDELSPVDSSVLSKKSLLTGEELVRNSGLSHSIIRFSGIYGPKRQHLIDRVKSGKARRKKSKQIANRIHRDDCVGSLYHLAKLEDPAPLYIGSDSEPTPYNDIITWLEEKLESKPIPYEEAVANSVHMSNKKCSNQLLIKSGYRFRYPSFREGMLSCL